MALKTYNCFLLFLYFFPFQWLHNWYLTKHSSFENPRDSFLNFSITKQTMAIQCCKSGTLRAFLLLSKARSELNSYWKCSFIIFNCISLQNGSDRILCMHLLFLKPNLTILGEGGGDERGERKLEFFNKCEKLSISSLKYNFEVHTFSKYK